ncbi:uncharacterized protein BX664DRAFT_349460 [Halteromyces radiatus]|uniref:uncharacterized protein n=1 Tax=Halteromyces radiatus TaxID=101107 RepID=UPI00221F4E01|nr:uncharacterized protein BX664DRAFT_349460 [Halteromyces radiatus]KAI8089039.1 hypothetical protein BX664DRAFT_349460 [Halteromyces radiatus]
MKFNVLVVSTAVLFFQQGFAAPTESQASARVSASAHVSASVSLSASARPSMTSTPSIDSSIITEALENLMSQFDSQFDLPIDDEQDILNLETNQPALDNALEADLIRKLGWEKTDSQVLTNFIEAVDKLGNMVDQEGMDSATSNMLSQFQANARQLINNAGYEYRLLADNRRILSRVSGTEQNTYREEMLNTLIERLVRGLVELLNSLRTGQGNAPMNTEVMNRLVGLITSVLQSVGRSLQDSLFPRGGNNRGGPGAGNVPTPGTGNIPTPGTGNVPTPGTGNVPTPGTGNVPTPGTGNVPTPGAGTGTGTGTGASTLPALPSPGTGVGLGLGIH